MLSSTAVTLPATKPRAQEVGRWLSLAHLEAFLWRLSSLPWNNRGEKRGLPVTWLYSVLFQKFETHVKNILGIFACNMANIKSMLGHYCPECRCQARFVNTFLGGWHWIVVNLHWRRVFQWIRSIPNSWPLKRDHWIWRLSQPGRDKFGDCSRCSVVMWWTHFHKLSPQAPNSPFLWVGLEPSPVIPRNPTGWCSFFCYVNVGL